MAKIILTTILLLSISVVSYCQSIYFDGTDDLIKLNAESQYDFLDVNTPFSISFWIYADRTTAFAGSEDIISKGENVSVHSYFTLYVNPSQYLQVNFMWTNTSLVYWYGGTVLPRLKWTHVVVTYNGDQTQTNSMSFYIDNKKAVTTRGAIGGQPTPSVTNNVMVGIGKTALNGGAFAMYMSDINFYSREITVSEIKELYNYHITCRNGNNHISSLQVIGENNTFADVTRNTTGSYDWSGAVRSNLTVPLSWQNEK